MYSHGGTAGSGTNADGHELVIGGSCPTPGAVGELLEIPRYLGPRYQSRSAVGQVESVSVLQPTLRSPGKPRVSVSYCCCNKQPQILGLKAT